MLLSYAALTLLETRTCGHAVDALMLMPFWTGLSHSEHFCLRYSLYTFTTFSLPLRYSLLPFAKAPPPLFLRARTTPPKSCTSAKGAQPKSLSATCNSRGAILRGPPCGIAVSLNRICRHDMNFMTCVAPQNVFKFRHLDTIATPNDDGRGTFASPIQVFARVRRGTY